MKRAVLALAWSIALCGCKGAETPAPATQAPAAEVSILDGLGPHRRTVTTSSPEAQQYFDRGLAYLYAFNHDEAIRSFTRATEIDPTCAMAWWGISYANGPHINNPTVTEERAKAAWDALAEAQKHAGGGTRVEQALIEALAARYAMPQPEDRAALDGAYADAMRAVRESHPDDADVGALYAEALMDLHPWDLWNHDGTPQPWTPPLVALLEELLALDPDHPLVLHLYIHGVEASTEPGKADVAADRLRNLTPALGHMVHMPSHIDVRRGRWVAAIESNTRAMEADHQYYAGQPDQGFYWVYMAHNHHMRGFAAMMIGRSELALSTMREMVTEMPEEWLRENALFADGWYAMPFEVLMRFGRWEEVLAEPEVPDFLPLSRALRHYARGVAYAATDRLDDARSEERLFAEAAKLVSPDAFFGNNDSVDLTAVAAKVLEGEILYRAGDEAAAFAALREAARLEDALTYSEPPDWIQPVRHPLGAALLKSGRHAEAEAVFREDLGKLPGNGWGLFGLARALRGQGKEAEAAEVEAAFADAWKSADITIDSPCLCQRGV